MYEYLLSKLRERIGVQWAIVRHSNLEILYKVGKWEQVAVRRPDMDNADGVDRRIVLVQLRRRDRREGLVPARRFGSGPRSCRRSRLGGAGIRLARLWGCSRRYRTTAYSELSLWATSTITRSTTRQVSGKSSQRLASTSCESGFPTRR